MLLKLKINFHQGRIKHKTKQFNYESYDIRIIDLKQNFNV